MARTVFDSMLTKCTRKHAGQVLILFGIMVPVLIACVALVADTGEIWIKRRGLQTAVDAAALAGAQELPESPGAALSAGACRYAEKNKLPGLMYGRTGECDGLADVEITQNNQRIRVLAYTKTYPIIKLIWPGGSSDIEVYAEATAIVGSIATSCPFPIFQTPEMLPPSAVAGDKIDFYKLTAMHLSGSDNSSGNFLTVDVGSGANAVLDAMVNNGCGNEIGPTASTEPGGKIGKVMDGFAWRIYCASGEGTKPNQTPPCPAGPSTCASPDVTNYLSTDADGNFDVDPAITRENCTRLVVVPIFPAPFDEYKGKTTVTLEGFAIFYISGYCDKASCTHPTLGQMKKGDSWGYYVRMTASGTDFTDYDGFGTKVVALVD